MHDFADEAPERALAALVAAIAHAARERLSSDLAFCTALDDLCASYAMLHAPAKGESALQRILLRLDREAGMRGQYSSIWSTRLQSWAAGGVPGVSRPAHLAVLFAYTMNLVPVFLLLNLDKRLAATSRRAALHEFHELLESAFRELPCVPSATSLFRGMGPREQAAWAQGGQLHGPLSCSTVESTAASFAHITAGGRVVRVHPGPGVHAVSLSSVTSAHANEQEVVLVPTPGINAQPYVEHEDGSQQLSRLGFTMIPTPVASSTEALPLHAQLAPQLAAMAPAAPAARATGESIDFDADMPDNLPSRAASPQPDRHALPAMPTPTSHTRGLSSSHEFMTP